MKKLGHSKFKNTGFLFEILVRQITSDIIGDNKNTVSERILAKYFNKNTELGKENALYQVLVKERSADERKAERIIDAVIDARKKLNEGKLREEKYNLVKDIKENYNVDNFFRTDLKNYKLLASIYKIFENSVSKELYNPSHVSSAKTTVVESIINTSVASNVKEDDVMAYFKTQDARTRKLSYNIFLENFNKKYSNLSTEQKELIREYILNVSNTNSLRETTNKYVDYVTKQLNELLYDVDESVTRIKLKETIKQLKNVKNGKIVKESQLSALLLSFELIKEIKNVTNS